MIIFRHLLAAVLMLGGLFLLPVNARAAQSYDSCVGFIDSLPVTISTQGTWCLRKDLATSMSSGVAINIATNNVTIDCNDFKIGGLAAGNTSVARGIFAGGRNNITVRHCAIRGFYYGIHISYGAGHLVEDNRLDNNLNTGIHVMGDNNRVRRNAVYDTGGYPGMNASYGILAAAHLIDNTVDGVFATATTSYPTGISVEGYGNEARGNQVSGLALAGSGNAMGIYAADSGIRLAGNHVSGTAVTAGWGIYGYGGNTFCTSNTVVNYASAYLSCEYNLDNLPAP